MTSPDTTYPNTPLYIDIPVKLDDVKAVFSIAALSFEGDLPASLFHLGLITNDIADWAATSEVVVVFHTNAATSRWTTRHITPTAASRPGTRTRSWSRTS